MYRKDQVQFCIPFAYSITKFLRTTLQYMLSQLFIKFIIPYKKAIKSKNVAKVCPRKFLEAMAAAFELRRPFP